MLNLTIKVENTLVEMEWNLMITAYNPPSNPKIRFPVQSNMSINKLRKGFKSQSHSQCIIIGWCDKCKLKSKLEQMDNKIVSKNSSISFTNMRVLRWFFAIKFIKFREDSNLLEYLAESFFSATKFYSVATSLDVLN